MATWNERLFRFILDFLLALAIFTLLSFKLTFSYAVIFSILIAHTINWTFNGSVWALSKFCGKKSDITKKLSFLQNLQDKAYDWSGTSLAVIAFGSLSRGEFRETSDIDVRIIRKPGILGCIKADIFALYLRSTAFLRAIPLDLFVLDCIDRIKEDIRSDEPPVVIYDPHSIISTICESSTSLRAIMNHMQLGSNK